MADVSLDATATRLTVRLSQSPPDADVYTLTVTDRLKMAGGLPLAGDRDLRINLLAGDVDGSGRVTATDMLAVREAAGKPGDVRFDVDGSGQVSMGDMLAVRDRLGHHLP